MLDVEHKQKKYFKMYEFKADYYYHEHRLRRFYHKGLHTQKESQNSREITFQCHCSYLHELQHAAKMCGVKLEFKVIKHYDEI